MFNKRYITIDRLKKQTSLPRHPYRTRSQARVMDEQDRVQEEMRKEIAELKEQLARIVGFLAEKANNKEGPSSGDHNQNQNQEVPRPETPEVPSGFPPHNNNLPPPLSSNPSGGNPPPFGPQPFQYPPQGFQYPYPIPPFYFTTTEGPHGQHKDPNADDPNMVQDLDNDPKSKEKLDILEERLRAIEGTSKYGFMDAAELCLVPDVVIPHKFKIPEFEKFNGSACPMNHLTSYCRKMASYAHNDKLLIHFFQDSLIGAASRWYTKLDRNKVRCWKDLADAFLSQYHYNIDMAPDRTQLQNMEKKATETFKEYAQRWRDLAAQVNPPLSDKEMVSTFMGTLLHPFMIE